MIKGNLLLFLDFSSGAMIDISLCFRHFFFHKFIKTFKKCTYIFVYLNIQFTERDKVDGQKQTFMHFIVFEQEIRQVNKQIYIYKGK